MVKEILMLCLFAQQATRVTAFPQNFNHEELEQQLMLEDAEFKQKAVQLCLLIPAAMLWVTGGLMGWQNMVENFMSLFGYNTLPTEPINITPTISVGPFKAAPKTQVGPARGYYLPGEIEYHPIMDVIKKQNLENQRRQEEIIKFHIQEQERLELLNNLPVQSGISGRHLLSDIDYTQMQKDLEGNFTLIIDLYKSLGHKFSTKKCTKEFNEFVKNSTDILYQTIFDYETSVSFTCTMPDTYKAACLIAPVVLDPSKVGDCQIDKLDKIDSLIEVKSNGTTFLTSAHPYKTTMSNDLTPTPRLGVTHSPSEEQQKTASHSLPETVTMVQDDIPPCMHNEALANEMIAWANKTYNTDGKWMGSGIYRSYAYFAKIEFGFSNKIVSYKTVNQSFSSDAIFIRIALNNDKGVIIIQVMTQCLAPSVNCSDSNATQKMCNKLLETYNTKPDSLTNGKIISFTTTHSLLDAKGKQIVEVCGFTYYSGKVGAEVYLQCLK